MKTLFKLGFVTSIVFFLVSSSCNPPRLFLSAYLKKTYGVLSVPCDPYGDGVHTCVVFSSDNDTLVYDASHKEMVLSDTGYFPLRIKTNYAQNLYPVVVNKKSPSSWFVSYQEAKEELYIVDASSKSTRSFISPKPISLPKNTRDVAAFEGENNQFFVLAIASNELHILSLDKNKTEIASQKSRKLPGEPNFIQIDDGGEKVIIGLKEQAKLIFIPMSEIIDYVDNNVAPNPVDVSISSEAQKIFLGYQKIGGVEKLLGLVFCPRIKSIELVDLANGVKIDTVKMDNFPTAAYVPSKKYQTLETTNNGRFDNWCLVADIQGFLHYFSIGSDGKLTKQESINVKKSKYFGVKSLFIEQIAPAEVLNQPQNDTICQRQLFFSVSSALNSEGVLVESNGMACEKEVGVYPLGPGGIYSHSK